MYKPDQTDWEIIVLLNKNGRASSTEIARQLGMVSARTVSNRIDNLIEHGIINIRSIINPGIVGYGVLADVFIKVEPGNVRRVADKLAELPQISYVVCATGEADIIISIRAQTILELYNFVIEVIGKIPSISNTRTYLLPLTIKNVTTWMPPDVPKREEDK